MILQKIVLALSVLAVFIQPLRANAPIRAEIFDLEGPKTSPTYTFQLVKSREGDVETWNSRYSDAKKTDYATENTTLQQGKLVRYNLFQPQLKEEAEVKVVPGGVIFRYLRDGKWKENFEKTEENVIAGPQIVETIRSHWAELQEAKWVRVRFAVPDRLETVGFRLTRESPKESKDVVVHFTPSNFVIRQFISPVIFTLSADTRQLKSIQGQTFLKKKTGDSWEKLKSEYRF